MAKLECFTIGGIELWFYSNDHLPPHFHAKRKGQWEVRVNFLESTPARMFSVVWAKDKGVPRADTNRGIGRGPSRGTFERMGREGAAR